MYFELDADQHQLSEATRALLAEGSAGFDRAAWRRGATLGWYGVLVSERYGGFCLTRRPLVDLVVVAGEFGRAVQPGPFLPTSVVALAIERGGTEEQKRRYLPDIASGVLVATWAIAEPGNRWDPSAFSVTAEPAGDGWVLDGVKTLVQDAEAADLILVTARAESGLVQLLVPAGTRGLTCTASTGLDRTRRWYDVRFDGVYVPDSAVLGPEVVAEQLLVAKVLQCAESAAGAARLVELSAGSENSVPREVAGLHVAAESAAAATYRAALAVADRSPDAAAAVDVAQIVANDAYAAIADSALQSGGDFGEDREVSLHLLRAKANQVLFGDSGTHRDHLGGLLELRAAHRNAGRPDERRAAIPSTAIDERKVSAWR
ncbi:acyl-CoA dehydrogenase family protein [Amycolatopsis jejuensis]|uniref:acyl-CoA dehydrogenase family protein n=1 Tax=Amycolatopsis jejuensis TaxID=330084 RepID=UPI0006895004|nr:acyl-CoA dehydrogenase [Amycolatopsis jejuensis]